MIIFSVVAEETITNNSKSNDTFDNLHEYHKLKNIQSKFESP